MNSMDELKRKKDLFTAVIAVALLYVVMESVGITCPIKYVTGISCAGCGMSRAYLSLLRGDIGGAFYYHPLFFMPPIIVIVFLLRKRLPDKLYKIFLFTSALIFIIVYIYRLFLGNGDIVVFHPGDNIVFRVIRQLAG